MFYKLSKKYVEYWIWGGFSFFFFLFLILEALELPICVVQMAEIFYVFLLYSCCVVIIEFDTLQQLMGLD